MPNPENLTPFTKDDNRAVEGGKKSRRKSLDKRMREWLESPAVDAVMKSKGAKELLSKLGVTSGSTEDAFRFALFVEGMKGNVKAIQECLDRAYGKAKQTIDHKAEVTYHEMTEKELENAAKGLKEFDDE